MMPLPGDTVVVIVDDATYIGAFDKAGNLAKCHKVGPRFLDPPTPYPERVEVLEELVSFKELASQPRASFGVIMDVRRAEMDFRLVYSQELLDLMIEAPIFQGPDAVYRLVRNGHSIPWNRQAEDLAFRVGQDLRLSSERIRYYVHNLFFDLVAVRT